MPVMEIHLVEGDFDDEKQSELVRQCAEYYAKVLESPIGRVRVFVTQHRPTQCFIAGDLASAGAAPAPYFTFIVLQGRSEEQRHELLSGFTDLIQDILAVDRERIRGSCWPVPPQDWAIGGVPASVKRGAEVRARERRG